jgi:group I intron endonuclease
MGFIYKITNTVTGKCYIGETIEATPEARWKRHLHTLKTDKGCPALKDAMKKYGVDNFKFEVLIICFDEDVHRYEKEYIQKYNSMVPNGYNILPGGQGGGGFKGKKHTPEAIAKQTESYRKFLEANPNYYDTYREKHRESMEKVNLSESVLKSERFQKAKQEGRLGFNSHKNQEETKQKISDSLKQYYQENKQTQKQKKAVRNANRKPIHQYTVDGKFIKSFDAIIDAERETKVKKSNIQQVLCGNTLTAGGFVWKYAEK